MYRIYFVLLLSLLFTACDDSSSDHSQHDHGHSQFQAEGRVAPPSNPVSVIGGVSVVEMTGNDRMKYNLETFSVPAGSLVKLNFRNVGKMPKAVMGHNVVFLKADVDSGAFATAAAAARDNQYIPVQFEDQILARTNLLGSGESDTIEFTAPNTFGDYEFLCSFPAHLFAGMRGVMTVE
jgi:azurin